MFVKKPRGGDEDDKYYMHQESTTVQQGTNKIYLENDYINNAASKFADQVEDEPMPETMKNALVAGGAIGGISLASKLLSGGSKPSSTPTRPRNTSTPTTRFGH